MSRTRQIKPHFLHSTSMSKVSVGAQLTFIRLWLIADDAGRIEDSDRPLRLPVTLYPCQDEPRQHVAGWLEELERVGCIVRYRVEGQPYLRVVNWRKHQRICNATPSRLPPEAAGVRESLVGLSEKAREAFASIAAKSPPPQGQAAVLANSGQARGALVTNAAEPAKQQGSTPLRERLARNFLFLRTAG